MGAKRLEFLVLRYFKIFDLPDFKCNIKGQQYQVAKIKEVEK